MHEAAAAGWPHDLVLAGIGAGHRAGTGGAAGRGIGEPLLSAPGIPPAQVPAGGTGAAQQPGLDRADRAGPVALRPPPAARGRAPGPRRERAARGGRTRTPAPPPRPPPPRPPAPRATPTPPTPPSA